MSARIMAGRRRIESASRRRETLAAIERLSGLLEGGISASDALSAAASCQGPGARLLHGVSLRVSKGMSLSRALEHSGGHLDATDIALVRAGEHSGDLPRSLELLTRRLARKHGSRRGLLRLLAYPSIVISSALLVVAGTSTFILPTFAALYSNGSTQLPTLTRVVLAAGSGAVEAAAGTCVTVIISSGQQLSETEAVSVKSGRGAVQVASAGRVIGSGQTMVGGVVSRTVTVRVMLAVLPAASDTV